MVLESVVGFVVRNSVVVAFYLVIALLVFLFRKKFKFYAKVIAMYRTNFGIPFMDRIASRHTELVRLFGYISIGVGFVGMFFIVFSLFQGVYNFFAVPNSPPAVAPILPGVRVPGVSFFIPLVKGVIAIFLVALTHEFAHGIVARAHGIAVKSTGLAIIGPFFAAFVEPDEEQLKKKSDVVNYSMIAAGPVANVLSFFVIVFIASFVFSPVVGFFYPAAGISFSSITPESPAANAGLEPDVIYTSVNGVRVSSVADFISAFEGVKPGEAVALESSERSYSVVAGSNPKDSSKAYLGVNVKGRFSNDSALHFRIVSWLMELFSLIGVLSLGIGLANLLPIGPLDGGKMLQQALHKVKGDEGKGNRALIKISLFFFLIILLLMSPVLKATFKAVFGA